jgi:hypothetical protein
MTEFSIADGRRLILRAIVGKRVNEAAGKVT